MQINRIINRRGRFAAIAKGALMKIFASMIAATLLMAASAAARDTSATQKKLMDLETAWSKAMNNKDVAALSAIIADDWAGQDDSGTTETKPLFLAATKSGDMTMTTMTLHDMKVRVFGNTGIVQGSDDEQSSFMHKDTSGVYTWMDVFENRGGKWVAVASQITMVSPKK
jgi:ketosteroid isomerase-like protein